MSQKDAERLRGRLQWFETFAYGRIAHQALRTISGDSVQRQRQRKLDNLGKASINLLEGPSFASATNKSLENQS